MLCSILGSDCTLYIFLCELVNIHVHPLRKYIHFYRKISNDIENPMLYSIQPSKFIAKNLNKTWFFKVTLTLEFVNQDLGIICYLLLNGVILVVKCQSGTNDLHME